MVESDHEAYAAAERLVREAHRRAEEAVHDAANQVPRSGWQSPRSDAPRPSSGGGGLGDLAALASLLSGARAALPPELARQLADALQALLVALRAIIDFAIDRLERPVGGERQVEDIPIQ